MGEKLVLVHSRRTPDEEQHAQYSHMTFLSRFHTKVVK